jgi:hypothetical protein
LLFASRLPAQTISFQTAKNFGVYQNPVGVAVADFNADGKLDLVVANNSSNNLYVMIGTGGGNFIGVGMLQAGDRPSAVAVGDFNGDGKLDLAVANEGTPPNNGTVSIILGQGNGFFTGNTLIPVGFDPLAIVVADFNRDGNADIAVVNEASDTVSILLGNGNGTFTAATTLTTGNVASSLAVGDFNRDGIPDLVVGIASTVSVFLGNGNGTFQAAQNAGFISSPSGVAVGDFNNDGISDLAVTSNAAGAVAILIGNGNGTFGVPTTFPVGSAPIGIVVGDFNADGKLDVAASGGNGVSILAGNGNGTFAASAQFAALFGPFGIASGDFDNNTTPDLVVTDSGAASISVFLNNTHFPVKDSFAVVSANGRVVRGRAGAFQYAHGRYEVSFPFDVSHCGYTATIGDTSNGLVYAPGLVYTAGGHSTSDGVYVETRDLNGVLADYPFHLNLTCTGEFAVVAANGNLARGGSTTVSSVGSNFSTPYEVVFNHNVHLCAYTATLGDTANGAPPTTGWVFPAGGHSSANDVYLETKNMGAGLSPFPFHLNVNCNGEFAVVGYTGNLVRHDPTVINYINYGVGRYEVIFNHNVMGCAYTATVADPSNGLVYSPGLVFTAGGHTSKNGVYIETKNPGGGLSYYPFHLTVSCN